MAWFLFNSDPRFVQMPTDFDRFTSRPTSFLGTKPTRRISMDIISTLISDIDVFDLISAKYYSNVLMGRAALFTVMGLVKAFLEYSFINRL